MRWRVITKLNLELTLFLWQPGTIIPFGAPDLSNLSLSALGALLTPRALRFWEALSGICSRTIQHPDSQVNRLCISPDKRFLAAAGHHTVKLYDIKSTNPNPLLSFDGHTGNITGIAFHCEGKWMVTSSEDGTVKIWETRSGTVQRSYSHGCPVNDVVIHPNQGEIISCDRGGSVRIWDLAENNCSHQLIPEEDVSVSSVTVASDGSTLCAGTNSVWFLFSSLKIYFIILTLLPPNRVASTSGTSYSTARRRS
jgi:WD40 repeat protein